MAEARYQLLPEEPDQDRHEGRMGFLEHLDELRTRIIRSCLAIGAGMLVAFFFVDRIGDFVLGPTLAALPRDEALVFTRPGEGFAFYLDLALIGGVVLSAPFVAYQVWGFIAPGLYAGERRLAVPFIVLAALGTSAAALFTHYVMFPATIAFFSRFHSPAMKFMPRVEDTFELYKSMMIGMIAVFQLPTLVFFLARMRLVTARFLWRNMKYAILIIVIAAALLTSSPDAWNQAVFAAPMIGLYLLSIVIAWLVAPKPEKPDSHHLRLVFAATVVEQARRSGRRPSRDRPRAGGGSSWV